MYILQDKQLSCFFKVSYFCLKFSLEMYEIYFMIMINYLQVNPSLDMFTVYF